jgi:hypothetical protein
LWTHAHQFLIALSKRQFRRGKDKVKVGKREDRQIRKVTRSCRVVCDFSARYFFVRPYKELLIHDVERSGNMFSLASEKHQQLKKSEE